MSKSNNAKVLKVLKFNPKLMDQNDKRNLKHARDEIEYSVTRNYNNLGMPCFAGVPILDPKRGVVGIELFTLADPLKDFFTKEVKESLLEAMQESMVQLLAKVKDLGNGEETEPLDAGDFVEPLAKPLKPVFSLNAAEIEAYFSALKSSLARKDGVIIKRKWAKMVKGRLEEPTKLPSFDEFVESVLPSSQYFGAKTKFSAGNLLWRLQLVCAYLLENNDCDYNTYAHNVPDDHVHKTWKIEDLILMGRDPKGTANNNLAKRKRNNKVQNIAMEEHTAAIAGNPFEDDDEEDGVGNGVGDGEGDGERDGERDGEGDDEEEFATRITSEAEVACRVSTSKNDMLDDSILGSHTTGSPGASREASESGDSASSFDKRIYEIERNRVQVNEKRIVLKQMRGEGNDLVTFSSGDAKEGGYILQAYNLVYVDPAKSYRATLSDSTKAVDKVVFNSSLNKQVEEELKHEKNIVKIMKHRIFNKSMIIVDEFVAYWNANDEMLGDPVLLNKEYMRNIFDGADANYATSPGNLERKVTNRNPLKLKKKTKSAGR